MNKLKENAKKIYQDAINAVLPDEAVKSALVGKSFSNRVILVSIGKASWQMAKSAFDVLGKTIEKGIVITKYGHSKGKISNFKIFEANHPVLDENSILATKKVLEMVSNLSENDTVLFLVSGGGSALFEDPLIPLEELKIINNELLSCGADIKEINIIRKRLSNVKGGKFAKICEPAKVFSIVLSDIVGDPLDMIASGPAVADTSTKTDALNIIKKYNLDLSSSAKSAIEIETPKRITNVEVLITGSVKKLCEAAKESAENLGYKAVILDDSITCEAKQAARILSQKILENCQSKEKLAFIIGGETVVYIKGNGKGGRNQELALNLAEDIAGLNNVIAFSIGSDGTDGPTDAAGAMVSGNTKKELLKHNVEIKEVLDNNDSYNALKLVNSLIFTGPTGTNVNDVSVALIN